MLAASCSQLIRPTILCTSELCCSSLVLLASICQRIVGFPAEIRTEVRREVLPPPCSWRWAWLPDLISWKAAAEAAVCPEASLRLRSSMKTALVLLLSLHLGSCCPEDDYLKGKQNYPKFTCREEKVGLR